jgi:uncharacterized membrane protein YsdA (DUF1294 family)
MNNIDPLVLYLIIANVGSYALMWIDKIKSVYQWWRVPEKTLWMLAISGGVFGIWLGMRAPLYHKAGKEKFRVGIPLVACMWGGILLYYFIK